MCTEKIKILSEKYYKKMVKLRHEFHMHPELAFKEVNTSKIVEEELKKLNIEVKTNIAKTGVIGLIKGKYPGKNCTSKGRYGCTPY